MLPWCFKVYPVSLPSVRPTPKVCITTWLPSLAFSVLIVLRISASSSVWRPSLRNRITLSGMYEQYTILGGHTWQRGGKGMCAWVVCIAGDMHGEGRAWQGEGIVHGKGACKTGTCVQERWPLKRAVCILLECNLTLVKSSLREVRLMSHQSDCSFRDYTYIFDRYCCCWWSTGRLCGRLCCRNSLHWCHLSTGEYCWRSPPWPGCSPGSTALVSLCSSHPESSPPRQTRRYRSTSTTIEIFFIIEQIFVQLDELDELDRTT